MKTKWLDRDLITGPYIALVLSEAEYGKAMKECGIPWADQPPWILADHADATVHRLRNPSKEDVHIVALRVRPGIAGVQVAAMLVHEAVHIWQWYKKRIGEKKPSKEFEAYSIQCISQRLMQAYADRHMP